MKIFRFKLHESDSKYQVTKDQSKTKELGRKIEEVKRFQSGIPVYSSGLEETKNFQ